MRAAAQKEMLLLLLHLCCCLQEQLAALRVWPATSQVHKCMYSYECSVINTGAGVRRRGHTSHLRQKSQARSRITYLCSSCSLRHRATGKQDLGTTRLHQQHSAAIDVLEQRK